MPRPREPRAGEIWYVDFSPQFGREQAGVRPALVESSHEFNDVRNDLVIVCPLTTRGRGYRYHVRIEPIDGVLSRTSQVMYEQVKSLDTGGFLQYRGNVPGDTLVEVQQIIAMFFNGARLSR